MRAAMSSELEEVGCRLLIITSSASASSRSEKLGQYISNMLQGLQLHVDHLKLRQLPAGPLLAADTANAEIANALAMLEAADGVIIITPTYKASYSGLLKVFIDLLPQYALRGKSILPVATGGTIAHVLMLDYGIRPVLQTMWPRHVGQGCFVLDKHLVVDDQLNLNVDQASLALLVEVMNAFRDTLRITTKGKGPPLPETV